MCDLTDLLGLMGLITQLRKLTPRVVKRFDKAMQLVSALNSSL